MEWAAWGGMISFILLLITIFLNRRLKIISVFRQVEKMFPGAKLDQ